MTKKKAAARRGRKSGRRRRYYAAPCMIAILALAAALTATGHALRGSLLAGLPQYDDAPDIAIPMMLLQDRGPLREARERAAWEAEQAREAEAAFAAPAEPEPTAVPAPVEPEPTAVPAPVEPEPTAAPAPVEPEPTAPIPERIDAEGTVPDAPEAEPTARPEVTEAYFDHTLFIGDSKVDGMRMWARLGGAHYFCGTNYSVYNLLDRRASDEAFKDAKLSSVLKKFRYDQIYIVLGYNEAGYPYENLMKQFQYVISLVHKAQPQARIILHGVMHASERVANKYDYYTPQTLERINSGLRALADEWDGLYYVDCNAPFCDENGYLLSSVSNDGEHLTPEYTAQWAQEIMNQAVVP